ncbi:hypothetical protein T06_4436 [Trichinella sp. T6]|nr:hypothetical protein T06_4436 [Trichinella sp. T6]
MIFALTLYGAKHPNGSKTETSAFNTPLLVSANSATRSGGRKIDMSNSLCQKIPSVFQSRLPSLGPRSLAGISSRHLPCREPLASLGSSREFHLTACQCRFAYSMRSLTLSNRLPKT